MSMSDARESTQCVEQKMILLLFVAILPLLFESRWVFCAMVRLSRQSRSSANQPAARIIDWPICIFEKLSYKFCIHEQLPLSVLELRLFPVQNPEPMCSRWRAQVLPDPGKLEIATRGWVESSWNSFSSAEQFVPSTTFPYISQWFRNSFSSSISSMSNSSTDLLKFVWWTDCM